MADKEGDKSKTSDDKGITVRLPSSSITSSDDKFTQQFWLAFIIAVANFLYSFFTGFIPADPVAMILDGVTFIVFWTSAGFKWAAILLLAELIVPLYLVQSVPLISLILARLPIWAAFAAIYKLLKDPQSSFSKTARWVIVVIVLFALAPVLYQAQLVDNYVVSNRAELQAIEDFAANSIQKSTTAAGKLTSLGWCFFTSVGDFTKCQEEAIPPEEKLAAQLAGETRTIPNQGLFLAINDFATTELVDQDSQAITIQAKNNLKNPTTLTFACGLENGGPGKADPAEKRIGIGTLSEQESTIICSGLNVTKKRTTKFYFNVTAKSVISAGERTMLVIDNNTKQSFIRTSSGITEDEKLLNTPQIGDLIRANQNALKAQVGADDLIQPIIKVAGVGSIQSKSPLVYGVAEGLTIPFGLFIKNNGRGRILSVNSISFTLPDLVEFDKANCDLTAATLAKVPWRVYVGENAYFIKICKLVVKKQKEYPNNLQALTIGVNVEYDYAVSKSKDVLVPGQVTS
jgi:hypothetical protein